MFFLKQVFTKVTIGVVIFTCGVLLATNYHKPDLFPIGFSGIGNTGYPKTNEQGNNFDGSPYPEDADYGEWIDEVELLDSTHCNFIGCSDGGLDKNITLNYM